MNRKMMKKVFPLLTLLLLAFASVCSAADWRLVTDDNAEGTECYVDAERAWFDGKDGSGFTKMVNKKTGYYATYNLKFTKMDEEGTFNATMAYGQIYDSSGAYVGADDGTTSNIVKGDAVIAKACAKITELKKPRKQKKQ